jgi:hypothetical protein
LLSFISLSVLRIYLKVTFGMKMATINLKTNLTLLGLALLSLLLNTRRPSFLGNP